MKHFDPPRGASYNDHLARSLGSKLFFIDHLPFEDVGLIVDFGCGDGALLKSIRHLTLSGCALAGIDRSPAQIAGAWANFPDATAFSTTWDYARGELRVMRGLGLKSVLILSSVMHEVLSQTPEMGDAGALMAWLEPLEFDYIVFRDMAVSSWCDYSAPPGEWLDALARVKAADGAMASAARDFHRRWGRLSSLTSFLHFLLKYPWRADEAEWARELDENYFPLTVTEWGDRFTEGQHYETIHHNVTGTRHFRSRVLRDFGIDAERINTHLEMVLRRRPRFMVLRRRPRF